MRQNDAAWTAFAARKIFARPYKSRVMIGNGETRGSFS